ncbi:hypothetical protein AAVH_23755 [Aphelenchoides avenae]|nr:hypothetical protein AAVH_23755 [Aphelenchus avenae]
MVSFSKLAWAAFQYGHSITYRYVDFFVPPHLMKSMRDMVTEVNARRDDTVLDHYNARGLCLPPELNIAHTCDMDDLLAVLR